MAKSRGLSSVIAGKPGGETITIIFSKPGLYYYYCANHALVNKDWHRVQAFKQASEYPIPMEGFILVVGK